MSMVSSNSTIDLGRGDAAAIVYVWATLDCCCGAPPEGRVDGPEVKIEMPPGAERDKNGFDTGYFLRCR